MIAGRRETFSIEVQPLAGAPPEGDPASAATWTAMRMYVAGRNLFRNIQREAREVSDDLHWPAIGVARWFVRSWPALFHTSAWSRPALCRNARDLAGLMDDALAEDFEAPDSDLVARDTFVASHSLRAAAAGGAFPDVWLSRDGPVVSVAWNDSMDGDIYFTLSRGEEDVPAAEFAEAVKAFVGWVRDQLRSRCPDRAKGDLELLEGWLDRFDQPEAAVQGILDETGLASERWRRLASLAGLGTDSPVELLGLGSAALDAGTLADARSSPIALAFRCTSPALSDEDLVDLRRAILGVPRSRSGFTRVQALADCLAVPAAANVDYVRGYRLARELRRALGNVGSRLDIEPLMDSLDIPVLDLPLSHRDLDGGCICDDDHGPAIFVNPGSWRASSAWGRRVVLAHELCHLLFDRDEAVGLAVISGPWAPPRIERTANAFAIELLLPLAGIMDRVGRAWERMTDSDVRILMDEFGLGLTAVTEHVRNMANPRNRAD